MFKEYNKQEEKEQIALLIGSVSKRSELLKVEYGEMPFDDYVKKYFEEPKVELTYKSKKNKTVMTETELIKYYKRAMCL